MDGWETTFILGRLIFRGYVSFREGRLSNLWKKSLSTIETSQAWLTWRKTPSMIGECYRIYMGYRAWFHICLANQYDKIQGYSWAFTKLDQRELGDQHGLHCRRRQQGLHRILSVSSWIESDNSGLHSLEYQRMWVYCLLIQFIQKLYSHILFVSSWMPAEIQDLDVLLMVQKSCEKTSFWLFLKPCTLPETNMFAENGCLVQMIPFLLGQTAYFQRLKWLWSFQGG